MTWILTVMTYLAGATWGPQVAMQTFPDEASCRAHEKRIVALETELAQTNIRGGAGFRQRIATDCSPQKGK